MDVLRTGCSALGCLEGELRHADQEGIADRLVASLLQNTIAHVATFTQIWSPAPSFFPSFF